MLDQALKHVKKALYGPGKDKITEEGPPVIHPLLIAEAGLHISRARRMQSKEERIQALADAQGALETIAEIHRSEDAWMLLAICLTERAIAQPKTRPASLDNARKCAEIAYRKNPNAAHALRQLGLIELRAADNLPWKEAEQKLNEAQRLLDQARSLDQEDYLSICLSADVLLQLAERCPREQARELARLARERYLLASKIDETWPNAFLGLAWTELLLARRLSGDEAVKAADAAMAQAYQALERQPDSSRPYRVMGNCKRVAGRIAPRETAETVFLEAFQHYGEGNKRRPDDYHLLTDWAFAYLTQAGRREGADRRQSLESAREKAAAAMVLEPDHPYAHVARGEALWRIALLEEGALTNELLEPVRSAYATALKISPDLEWGLVLSARLALTISELAPKEKRGEGLPEAETILKRVLEIRSDNEVALEALGDVRSRLALDRTDYAAAIEEAREGYDKARQIDPHLDHSHLRVAEIDVALAKINKDSKRMADAIEAYRWAVRQFPDRARAHAGLAKALEDAVSYQLWTGDPEQLREETMAAHRQATALDPKKYRPTNS